MAHPIWNLALPGLLPIIPVVLVRSEIVTQKIFLPPPLAALLLVQTIFMFPYFVQQPHSGNEH